MWAGGGWWLSQNWPTELRAESYDEDCIDRFLRSEPFTPYSRGDPFAGFTGFGNCRDTHTDQQCIALYHHCAEHARAAGLLEQEQRQQAEYHSVYLRDASLRVGAVILSPALLAAALALAAWVLSGFRNRENT